MSARTARAMSRFVSRGGEKLEGALDAFDFDVTGLCALDAGASTGGFTDCLLRRGASRVIAVDVAYGILDWGLRNDARVRVMERTNVRTLELDEPVDLIVADLAFIGLSAVAGAFAGTSARDLVLMVKPQFELPRARVPRGGVVRERDAWIGAMQIVADAYRARGFVVRAAAASPITGPKGNREFFIHLAASGVEAGDEIFARAAEEAP